MSPAKAVHSKRPSATRRQPGTQAGTQPQSRAAAAVRPPACLSVVSSQPPARSGVRPRTMAIPRSGHRAHTPHAPFISTPVMKRMMISTCRRRIVPPFRARKTALHRHGRTAEGHSLNTSNLRKAPTETGFHCPRLNCVRRAPRESEDPTQSASAQARAWRSTEIRAGPTPHCPPGFRQVARCCVFGFSRCHGSLFHSSIRYYTAYYNQHMTTTNTTTAAAAGANTTTATTATTTTTTTTITTVSTSSFFKPERGREHHHRQHHHHHYYHYISAVSPGRRRRRTTPASDTLTAITAVSVPLSPLLC